MCRQTLAGHKDDVLSISGLPPPTPMFPSHTHSPHNIPNGHASMDETYREVHPCRVAKQHTAMLKPNQVELNILPLVYVIGCNT